eukprot:TRINITY_DN30143_c0_g1_i1.p3 TRINITY_DN30143_c0_g1~~TRINITY_DN30143_c0_g1_i1.p3  ORF type:complete len:140 (-),score=15.93 TRINITY_DN30143_c0_g1_i1:227-646(-)
MWYTAAARRLLMHMSCQDCRASAIQHAAQVLRREYCTLKQELERVEAAFGGRRYASLLRKDVEQARIAAETANQEAQAARAHSIAVWTLGGIEKQRLVLGARVQEPPVTFSTMELVAGGDPLLRYQRITGRIPPYPHNT